METLKQVMACTVSPWCNGIWIDYLPLHIPFEHSEQKHYFILQFCMNTSNLLFTVPEFSFSSGVYYLYASRQWLKSEDIQRISLFFHNKSLEKEVRSSTTKLASFTPQWIYCCFKVNYRIYPYCSFFCQHLAYPEIL